jgi:receptor protein-tyrosine kinase
MIKILEALRRGQGEIAEVLPQVLEEPPQSRGTTAPADSDEAAVQAVLGDWEPIGLATRISKPVSKPANESQEVVREVPLHVSASTPLLPFDDTNFAAAEQYRMIRTRVIQHPKQPRLILISSAGPGDGKSVTAVNLSGALSLKTEAHVLLADTDFRRPTIHIQLGLAASPGLADVLSGTATLEEALVRTEQFPNLYVIPAGKPCSNPSELLDSTRWGALCNQLRTRFRYVIADSPPVASVADYELLQATCDGVVLVARPDHTKRKACLRALETIPQDKLIGVVMNCVGDWFMERGSYAPYYYYGSRR